MIYYEVRDLLKSIFSLIAVLLSAFLVGCQLNQIETMALLDEKIVEVNLSKSDGFDEMNLDILHTFSDEKSIKQFERAISTAQKQMGKVDVPQPEYDVMITYASENDRQLPTHAIHLWLGKENEKAQFMYLGDDEVYVTTKQITKKLRMLIVSDE